METRSIYDVRPEQYATVIREMIGHEDDVANHRIMWSLIIQGLLVNAYASAHANTRAANGIAFAGILVTLSAFVMLYKSYQARGYLHFLGEEAKRGRLQEEYMPLEGWPTKRITHWRRNAWICPWLWRAGDLLEPYMFLPSLTAVMWTLVWLQPRIPLSPVAVLGVALVMTALVLSAFCIVWVWSQKKDEKERAEATSRKP